MQAGRRSAASQSHRLDRRPARVRSAWPEHLPVAEGLAVRDALRFALEQCRIEVAELDEKSLPDLAATTFAMSSTAINTRLTALGATVGRPWRKEQKLACLSAWFAVSARR